MVSKNICKYYVPIFMLSSAAPVTVEGINPVLSGVVLCRSIISRCTGSNIDHRDISGSRHPLLTILHVAMHVYTSVVLLPW